MLYYTKRTDDRRQTTDRRHNVPKARPYKVQSLKWNGGVKALAVGCRWTGGRNNTAKRSWVVGNGSLEADSLIVRCICWPQCVVVYGAYTQTGHARLYSLGGVSTWPRQCWLSSSSGWSNCLDRLTVAAWRPSVKSSEGVDDVIIYLFILIKLFAFVNSYHDAWSSYGKWTQRRVRRSEERQLPDSCRPYATHCAQVSHHNLDPAGRPAVSTVPRHVAVRQSAAVERLRGDYTVFRKKTPTHVFLLYLRGTCLHLRRIFRVCLWWIHRSQSLIFITTAASKTFYQTFTFYRETHYLETCKHDVRITPPVAMNI